MDTLKFFLDLFLHLGDHLDKVVTTYQSWTYLFLFLVIFAETGLVVTPFLPGDSLLFAAGMIAGSRDTLNIGILFIVLFAAAVLGDTVNYHIGKIIGPRVFRDGGSRFLKREHLDKTHRFFEKYGGKTIILARFVPIVRTFAPFVAGMGSMTYGKFLLFNIVGAFFWVGGCTGAGVLLGNHPWFKEHFHYVTLAIVAVSLIPPAVETILHRRAARRAADVADAA